VGLPWGQYLVGLGATLGEPTAAAAAAVGQRVSMSNNSGHLPACGCMHQP
jgi:hypothetical protein